MIPVSDSGISNFKQEKIKIEKSIKKSEAKKSLEKTKANLDKIEVKNAPNSDKIMRKLKQVSDVLETIDKSEKSHISSDSDMISKKSKKYSRSNTSKINKSFNETIGEEITKQSNALTHERHFQDEMAKKKLMDFLNPTEISKIIEHKLNENKAAESYYESFMQGITLMGAKLAQNAMGIEALCTGVVDNLFDFFQKHVAADNKGYTLLKNLPDQSKKLAERLIQIDDELEELDNPVFGIGFSSIPQEEIDSQKETLFAERSRVCESLEPLKNELLNDTIGDFIPKILTSVALVSEGYLVTMAEVTNELKIKFKYFDSFPHTFKEYLILNTIAEQQTMNSNSSMSSTFELMGLTTLEKNMLFEYGNATGRIEELEQNIKKIKIDLEEKNKLEQERDQLIAKKDELKVVCERHERKIKLSLEKFYSADLGEQSEKLIEKLYLILCKNIDLNMIAKTALIKQFSLEGSVVSKNSDEILKGVLKAVLSKAVDFISDQNNINSLLLYQLNSVSSTSEETNLNEIVQNEFINNVVKSLVGELKTEAVTKLNSLIDEFCANNLNQSFVAITSSMLKERAAKIFELLQYKGSNRLLIMEIVNTLGDRIDVG